ncbi:protein gmr [Mycobacterium sp. PO1]|nr:protein gmr [Mycobacterium sp. PO1]GFM26583.1 protein gmr [Mycobacterium sp. PO2]
MTGPEAPEWRSRAASSVPLPPGAGTELDLDCVAQLRDRFGPPAPRRDLILSTVDRDRELPSQRLPARGSPDDWRMRRTRTTPQTPKPFTTHVMCYLHLDG